MTAVAKEAAKRLYEIVESQQGYFTAKQAKKAGYLEEAHVYHVKAGNWIRERRGIYRLAQFPPSDRPDLVLWYLWSRNREDVPQGVFSHQTALGIYELSDVNPSTLHMTVPKGFRRSVPIPKTLVLHFDDLPDTEVESMRGFRVTKPLRTIMDCLKDGSLSIDLVSQAFHEAMTRGLITKRDVERQVGKIKGNDPFDMLCKKVIE